MKCFFGRQRLFFCYFPVLELRCFFLYIFHFFSPSYKLVLGCFFGSRYRINKISGYLRVNYCIIVHINRNKSVSHRSVYFTRTFWYLYFDQTRLVIAFTQ